MLDQLRYLRDVLVDDASGVRLRTAPITCGTRAALSGPFVVMEFSEPEEVGLVYLEGREAAQYMQTESDCQNYRRQFDELRSHSLDRQDSRDRLDEVISELLRAR